MENTVPSIACIALMTLYGPAVIAKSIAIAMDKRSSPPAARIFAETGAERFTLSSGRTFIIRFWRRRLRTAVVLNATPNASGTGYPKTSQESPYQRRTADVTKTFGDTHPFTES